MGKFHDLTDSLGYGDDGVSLAYPESFITDATAAYDEDMSIPVARVSVLEADLAAAHAEITRLKAHNYELLTQVPAEESESADGDNDADDDNSDDGGEGIDSLFGGDDNEDKD